MHPSSASSSSSMSSGAATNGGGSLMRYGSAPGSLLTAAADSVVGPPTREFSALGPGPARFFHPDASDSAAMQRRGEEEHGAANTTIGLQPSYGFGGGSSTALLRQSSSPAGFLNHLATAAGDRNVTRGIGSYNSKGVAETGGGISRLNSQLSFTGKESLSRISELEAAEAAAMDNHHQKKSYATTSSGGGAFGMWEASSNNPIMFSVAQPNRGKHVADSLDESQFQFSISQTAQDMEKLINIPQDSVTCKIRAKRGFATHPRSIAERERRTRISGKLRKLQDLVPNMDKQTSYADMLDLAVQHIKTLQDQVEKLNHDLDNCSCGCKKTRDN
ncbi:transcription factor bHLH128-like isoform X4 [Salvia hispanica]|uniref:transcription factor bHLH128-like isoform X4 n=1 Tax=Salvia hispanica TaxID=49212 RepID=UPI002009859B|nr:transcription factor bHLH128-like isoform X4 [Salvia hispanica]